jgi:peptidyl-prolyl cis-trans isomerase D
MLQRIHDTMGPIVISVVLVLVVGGFVFWNVSSSTFGGGATFAAKVNGEKVPLTEFDRQLQARQNQYQQLYRTELTEETRRDLRRAVLEDMVRTEALRQRADKQGYRVSDRRLEDSIRDIAAFQIDGQYSEQLAVNVLASQGISPITFRELQRENMEIGDLQDGIADSTFLTPAEFRRYIALYNQRREVAFATFDAESFAPKVTVEDDAIAARYESNQASYQTIESVDLEYVELTLADIAATVEVTEDDLRAAYDEEKDRFETPEERHAHHILIEVGDDGEDAARAQAQSIADRIRGGEDFEKLAKELSADAGTKSNGGDLGWMSKGALVGPFEDALFAMQPGTVSDPVRTEFGFHVIRLDEVRGGEVRPYEAVRDDLATELRTRRAEDEFYDRANKLDSAAFDAYNALAPVAEEMKLPLKTLAGFERTGDSEVFSNSPAVVQAAFAEEIVDNGRNSPLVELGDDHVLVLRDTAHHLPMTKPLDEVRDQIREEITRERTQKLAEEAAAAFLADLTGGAEPEAAAKARGGTWTPAAWIQRTTADVPTEILSGVFAMPKGMPGVPQRETIPLANGDQAVVVLTNVEAGQPSGLTQAERDQRQKQLADQSARAELTAYVGNVRAKASVAIPPEVLEPPAY